ncbi:VOC family protein [Streptomyces sp. NPDC054787]
MPVQPVPQGSPRVTPYLCVDGAAAAIDFYVSVLGAHERMRMAAPGDKIGHAELELGNSVIMLADEYPDMGFRSPKAVGGTPVTLHVYVEDVDAVFRQGPGRGCHPAVTGQGRVLRRPHRTVRGPLRPSLEHRHAHRGRRAAGDGEAVRGSRALHGVRARRRVNSTARSPAGEPGGPGPLSGPGRRRGPACRARPRAD